LHDRFVEFSMTKLSTNLFERYRLVRTQVEPDTRLGPAAP
jgi:hypothetical protein